MKPKVTAGSRASGTAPEGGPLPGKSLIPDPLPPGFAVVIHRDAEGTQRTVLVDLTARDAIHHLSALTTLGVVLVHRDETT